MPSVNCIGWLLLLITNILEIIMNKKLLLLAWISAMSFCFNLIAQDHQDWKFMHPSPQSNPVQNTQIINSNTWVSVGGNGLFMKTTNAGVNWYFHYKAGTPNSAGTVGPVGDLYFVDANNGLVTGANGYIAKTTDGGVTFNAVGVGVIPVGQSGIRITFVDPNVGYIYCRAGGWAAGSVVKTTDGGMTWSIIYTNSTQAVTTLCVPDKQTLYAVLIDGSVDKSTDGGLTWTISTTVVAQAMYASCFLDANNILLAGSGGIAYRTTDGGATWVGIQTPQTEWAYYQLKMVSATEIYGVGDASNLWKTTDFGTTWTALPLNITWGTFDYLDWYSLDISGSLYVLSGYIGVVLISTDKGTTWGSHTLNYNSNIYFDIKKAPGSNLVLAAGRQHSAGSSQILRSTDGGTNFSPVDLYTNFDAYALSMVSDKIGYVCGTNSVVMKTTNGGTIWNKVTSPNTGTASLYSMKFVNENTGWVFLNYSGSDTNVFKTTDGGTSWVPQITSGAGYGIASADMADADNGYLCMNSSGKPIYKTNDGGANWVPVTTPFTGQIRSIKVIDKNTLYIATSYGTKRVAKSLDGGATWTTYSLPAAIDVNTMDFKDANTGYVCGNLVTAACRTTDGGDSWTIQNYHLPTGAKIYITPGDTAFATGTWGSILRNVSYAVTSVKEVSSGYIPNGYSLSQNYPNPFNPSTTINFAIPVTGFVILKIYDVLGKEKAVLLNENKEAGTYNVDFSADKFGLTSGVYLYKLSSGNFTSVRKFVLLK
jgi:photosystem II stability/assembly factor-like uncharacterized protein